MSSLPKWTKSSRREHQHEQGAEQRERPFHQKEAKEHERSEQGGKQPRPVGHQETLSEGGGIRVVLHENDAPNWPSTYDPQIIDFLESEEHIRERRWARRLFPRFTSGFSFASNPNTPYSNPYA